MKKVKVAAYRDLADRFTTNAETPLRYLEMTTEN